MASKTATVRRVRDPSEEAARSRNRRKGRAGSRRQGCVPPRARQRACQAGTSPAREGAGRQGPGEQRRGDQGRRHQGRRQGREPPGRPPPTRKRREHLRQPVARSVRCRRQEDDQAAPRSAATSPTSSSTPSCPPRRSPPSRSRTSSRCSPTWASTSSRAKRPTRTRRRTRTTTTRPTANSSKSRRRPSPKPRSPSRPSAPTIPCACICARWARSSCSSREGEIAIAKRIEAGREAMIAGLCESPLTFQAIIIWRDELQRRKDLPARHHRSRSDLCRPRRQEQA